MGKYHEDLEFAKKIVKMRNLFADGKFDNDERVTNNAEKCCWRFTENHYKIIDFYYGDVVESSESIITESTFLVEDEDTAVWFGSDDISISLPYEFTEEIHFQNSLIYDDYTNKILVMCWYITKHKHKETTMIEIHTGSLDLMLSIIDEMENI